MNREIEIDRFRAMDADGKEYVVVIYQTMVSAASHNNIGAEIPGLKRLTTLDGTVLNYVDSETFKIVATDEIIRKIR
jgi:hypothetical protein